MLEMNLFPAYCALVCAVQVSGFHIPDLNIDTEVGLDNNVVNSHIHQNWSQSLNIGSASLVGLLVVLFVTLLAYARLQAQLSQQCRCLTKLQDDFISFKSQKTARQGRSQSSVC